MKKILFLLVLIYFNSITLNAQRRLNFVPATHGFHFQNHFINYAGPVHTDGLCGGMCLAAFNYFRYNTAIPLQRNAEMNFAVNFDPGIRTVGADALTDYIFQSQMATYANASMLNFLNPIDADYNAVFSMIKTCIDRGDYLILGLKDRLSFMGHQVLCYGYDDNGRKILVYDPNQNDVESVITPFPENGHNLIELKTTGNNIITDSRYRAIFVEQELIQSRTSNLTQYNQVSNVANNYNYAVRPPANVAVANSNFRPESFYKIINVNSHKAIEVKNYSRDNGAEICQWDFHGGDNQLWKLTDAGDGYYYISSALTGKNLDVSGFSQDNGGRIVQWDNTSGKNQQWGITRTPSDGSYTLTNRNSGKVVDINGASRDNAGVVHQWQNINGLNQKFMIELVR